MTLCPDCGCPFSVEKTQLNFQFASCPACFSRLAGNWINGEFVIMSACLPEGCATLDDLPEHVRRRAELQ
jgi:hypothetical protein